MDKNDEENLEDELHQYLLPQIDGTINYDKNKLRQHHSKKGCWNLKTNQTKNSLHIMQRTVLHYLLPASRNISVMQLNLQARKQIGIKCSDANICLPSKANVAMSSTFKSVAGFCCIPPPDQLFPTGKKKTSGCSDLLS